MLNKISYLAIDSNSPTTTTILLLQDFLMLLAFFFFPGARAAIVLWPFWNLTKKGRVKNIEPTALLSIGPFCNRKACKVTQGLYLESQTFCILILLPRCSYSIIYFLGLQTHQVNQTLNNNDFVIVPPTNHGIY